tara:strand:- start:52 stop:222 length:171 start_codon:yes stop_codon:yes gene_type:complete
MIILKKNKHYQQTLNPAEAEKLVKEGFEVLKGKSLLAKAKKESKPKKKATVKSNKK